MRDIKFRVWDKKTKKMRQLVNIVFNAGFGVETNDNTIKLVWVKGKDIIEDKDIQIQREDNFELMQYTGVHDENGKEIYEKMIINNEYIVVYDFCKFALKNIYTGNVIDFEKDGVYEITGEYFK